MSTGEIRYRIVSGLGGRLLESVLRTVRFVTEGAEPYQQEHANGRPVIFTLWHGRLLPLSWYHRSRNFVTLISESADGEYIARVVHRWGYKVVRGSSSRGGGPAFRELVRWLRQGRSIAVTPDGPRGPRQKLKPGVLAAAQLTGFALLPVSAGANRAWWFEGWDRFLVPKPFSTVRIQYGKPVLVPRHATQNEIEEISARVEADVNRLTELADRAASD